MLLALIDTFNRQRYRVFSRPFELNIVGVRSDSVRPNSFDDTIHVFFKNNGGQWIYYHFAATTDPGTYWLKNPMQDQGTAILKAGQYVDGYQIGLHRGQYEALVQRKPVSVLRDYDRDAVLDFMNGREMKGMFGINIHRASVSGTTKVVDKYSAGCQVFSSVSDFNLFMQLCKQHKRLYGNQFTYTLIDNRSIVREVKKSIAFSVAGLAAAVGCALVTYQMIK